MCSPAAAGPLTCGHVCDLIWRVDIAEQCVSATQALTVLEFVVKRGSEQAVENAQNLLSKLSDLQVFEYTSPDGRDHGINVRHR